MMSKEVSLVTIKLKHSKKMRSLPTRKKTSLPGSGTANSNPATTTEKTNSAWKISKNVKVAICEEIESQLSVNKSGRYPKGQLKEIIDLHLTLHGSWMTRTMIRGYLRRRRAKTKVELNSNLSSSVPRKESLVPCKESPVPVEKKTKCSW